MVFSFFKKPPEKMLARPAAVPRSTSKTEIPAPPPEAVKADDSSLDFSEFVFSESSPNFQLEEERDPVDAEAEEASVLFANGQDEAVLAVLENAVRVHKSAPAERLWLMLFDLYRLMGQKAAFETLEIEYARAFEKSPPGWRDKSKVPHKAKELATGSLLFKGDLTGDNDAAFEAVAQALEKNPKLRLDLSKVNTLDAAGCGRLLSQLQSARKAKRALELLGRDIIGALVQERVETGRAEDSECWLLLLELCQLQGQHDAFEEVAINYAVTFEVSPPSWEPKRIAAPEPAAQLAIEAPDSGVAFDAYVIRGDVKSSRFADLTTHAEMHDPVIIDCSELARMDFISAGALLNVLTTIRRSDKQIVFHHPNHLVAELFGVVGLKSVATIVFAKH